MATVTEVLAWRPEELQGVVDEMLADRGRLTALDDELIGGRPPQEWVGDDADAARRGHELLSHRLNDLTAEVASVARAVGDAAAGAVLARRVVEEAAAQARGNGMVVEPLTGTVVDPLPPDLDPAIADDRVRLRDELSDRIQQGLRAADHTDASLAAALGRVASSLVDGGTGSLDEAARRGTDAGRRPTLPMPVLGDPGEVNGWWESLTHDERARLLIGQPELIGNTDGIPWVDRDTANRAFLPVAEKRLREQLAISSRTLAVVRVMRGMEAPDDLRTKIADLVAIRRVIEAPGTSLLSLGLHGKRFVTTNIAVGDVERAKHVVTTISGTQTRPAASLVGKVRDAEDLREAAEQLTREDDSVAAVVSMGYEAPQLDLDDLDPDDWGSTGREVYDAQLAEESAPDLARFLNSIDVTRSVDPHLTVAAHSYGAVVASHTLQEGTGVDAYVSLGAPGSGVDDVHDLRVPEHHVFNLEAKDDPIADLGYFGKDPTYLDGVRELDTAGHPDRGLHGIEGHTRYYEPGSTSQHNIAAVVADRPDLAIDDTRGPDPTDLWRERGDRVKEKVEDTLEATRDGAAKAGVLAGKKTLGGLSRLDGLLG